MKRSILIIGTVVLLLSLPMSIGAQLTTVGTPPRAAEPVMLTSCGQSPGPVRLKVFMDRLQMDYVYNTLATAADLVAAQQAGKPFKTLIIVTGASLKGMGAAGVSVEDELARTTALIAEAEEQGIMLVGAHVEGMERRAQGAAQGDNSDEQSIDAVCPQSRVMFVRKDGDEDHRFSVLSQDGTIPLILFEKNLEIQDALKLLFGK